MTSNRIKLTSPVISTRAEAERVLGDIAASTAALNAAKAKLDQRLTSIRQEHEGTIDQLAKRIEALSGLLQQWAEASPEEFGGKKSIDFIHGTLGFRTGMPKLKTLAGWTWDKVLGALDAANHFVRIKREVDKEGVLMAYGRGELDDAELRGAGMRVVQDESFFVEPKLEEQSGKIVTSAN
ncbi:host-nuclease inhibitor Gam family protein [Opitutus terrae]|uniref:Mu Gam family protein n=1 Tax=Opitutus terrae (strain DSM 11246 / JCM 15787 / PB90-1) TaxID=452637 RepID=B1ZUA4_OPITP|nr:host-nuclease inhibitor Gam family protein [Opitutus terrae]ACB76666.1 Mu Gam family protein [Opitutus terrae PB90-1]